MNKSVSIHEALQAFAGTVKAKTTQLTAGEPEDQLRGPFENFMAGVAVGLGWNIVCTGETPLPDRLGRPDYAVHLNQLLTGYVELKNCLWLRWVLNWAVKWRGEDGRYLMRENPLRGFDTPVEENPNRPVVTTGRYDALRAVSDDVLMDVWWDGSERQRSYLSELLDLAHGTGRRITAICALRYEDLRLEAKPYGAIRWPAATDKQGRETTAPISPTVRAALDRVLRERPGIGARCLFPSPANPDEPVGTDRVRRWLLKAEGVAGLPKQQGSLWHAFRRGWATARKHHPLTDTAAAGGWSSTETLLRCYQQPDDETMLAVVLGGAELRERKAL